MPISATPLLGRRSCLPIASTDEYGFMVMTYDMGRRPPMKLNPLISVGAQRAHTTLSIDCDVVTARAR